MEDQTANAAVRAALFEFQRYLSDQVPPLMAVDSVETLVRVPPQIVLGEIQAWTANQFRGRGASVPLSDYLYHAVKKIHLFGELNLLPAATIGEYIAALVPLLLQVCPDEDREFLRSNLSLLGDSAHGMAAPVDILHRQAGSEGRHASSAAIDPATVSERAARSLEQVTTLLERIQRQALVPLPAGSPARNEVDSQVISTAALGATNAQEFRTLLDQLQDRGIDTSAHHMFRALSSALPGWAVPAGQATESTPDNDSDAANPLQAMHRIISMAEDPGEGARRFREMLDAAIAQFNTGDLPRAATMFDLADRIVAEKRVDDSIVSKVRASAHEELDQEQLRQYVEKKEKHFLLRRVFAFFTRLSPDALLSELEHEEKRDRRRSLLALIEVHGAPARALALELLMSITPGVADQSAFFARNLLFILNHIPRPADASVDKELDAVAAFTTLSNRPMVVKEAFSVLGQTHTDRSEKILVSRLRDTESALLRPTDSRTNTNELRQHLDRIIAALLRIGSPQAIRAVIEHGLKTQEPLGDARARLAPLGSIDLTEQPDAAARLVAAVRSELPAKVLGFVAGKKQPHIVRLLDALAGTPSPEVRELLDEITTKYQNRDFAERASAILSTFGAAATRNAATAQNVASSMSGDLELFGLPNLLQSLAESQVTGVLALTNAESRTVGSIAFESGNIRSCRSRSLRGREALFQLFENPSAGNFAFYARRDPGETPDFDKPVSVAPLVLEAMRRHDELRRARLIVPDSMPLRATGVKPSPLVSETDARIVREVWLKAASGARPADWEKDISADSYRVWRLLSHWVESGALQVVPRET